MPEYEAVARQGSLVSRYPYFRARHRNGSFGIRRYHFLGRWAAGSVEYQGDHPIGFACICHDPGHELFQGHTRRPKGLPHAIGRLRACDAAGRRIGPIDGRGRSYGHDRLMAAGRNEATTKNRLDRERTAFRLPTPAVRIEGTGGGSGAGHG